MFWTISATAKKLKESVRKEYKFKKKKKRKEETELTIKYNFQHNKSLKSITTKIIKNSVINHIINKKNPPTRKTLNSKHCSNS